MRKYKVHLKHEWVTIVHSGHTAINCKQPANTFSRFLLYNRALIRSTDGKSKMYIVDMAGHNWQFSCNIIRLWMRASDSTARRGGKVDRFTRLQNHSTKDHSLRGWTDLFSHNCSAAFVIFYSFYIFFISAHPCPQGRYTQSCVNKLVVSYKSCMRPRLTQIQGDSNLFTDFFLR